MIVVAMICVWGDFFPNSEISEEQLLLSGEADYCAKCQIVTLIAELEDGFCLVCRSKMKGLKHGVR